MSVSGITGFTLATQLGITPQNRQVLPGNSSASSSTMSTGFSANLAASMAAHSANNMPTAQLKSYFTESPAQRMQDDWLSQHGISQAQFNSMGGVDKQKIVDEMKQDIEAKMKQKMGAATGTSAVASAPVSTSAATDILA